MKAGTSIEKIQAVNEYQRSALLSERENRTALSLLQHEKTCKNGIAITRQKADWDPKYL